MLIHFHTFSYILIQSLTISYILLNFHVHSIHSPPTFSYILIHFHVRLNYSLFVMFEN